MPITETFIKPEIFRPPQKANYTISDLLESELDDTLKDKLVESVIASTGPTINLETAVGYLGHKNIKNATGAVLTVSTNGSETIDGETSILLLDNESLALISDGSNWLIV